MLAGRLGSRLSPVRLGLTIGLQHGEFALPLPVQLTAAPP